MTSFMIDALSVWLDHRVSFDRRKKRCTFVLHEEHQEFGGRRLARVSANDVYVVRSLVESLSGPQYDGHSIWQLKNKLRYR